LFTFCHFYCDFDFGLGIGFLGFWAGWLGDHFFGVCGVLRWVYGDDERGSCDLGGTECFEGRFVVIFSHVHCCIVLVLALPHLSISNPSESCSVC